MALACPETQELPYVRIMRKSRKAIFLAGFLFLGLVCFAQVPRQVKVIIDDANIRFKPELDAEILDIAAKGTLFEVIEKAGAWYTIKMGEDQAGKAVYGYIHESMVEPIGSVAPKPQVVHEPEPAPPPPPPIQEPPGLLRRSMRHRLRTGRMINSYLALSSNMDSATIGWLLSGSTSGSAAISGLA